MVTKLLFCLVFVLYFKWIFIFIMYMCEALNVLYIRHKTNVLYKIMAAHII